jgi:hypothetical protein
MVLSQPENKHVLKAFDLTGKVAAVTGTTLLWKNVNGFRSLTS